MRINRAIKILNRRASTLGERVKKNPEFTFDVEERLAILKMISTYLNIKVENDLYRSLLRIEEKHDPDFDESE